MKPHNDERKVCTIIYFKNQIECYSQETIFRNDSSDMFLLLFHITTLHLHVCENVFTSSFNTTTYSLWLQYST